MNYNYRVTAFYRFAVLAEESLSLLKLDLTDFAKREGVLGLVLLGKEGINGTVAGPEQGIWNFKAKLRTINGFEELEFKDSESEVRPFRRFKVDIRPEIVTLKKNVASPIHKDPTHLSPEEWQAVIDSTDEFLMIDVRNEYETAIGKFEGAVDPKLQKFSDFPKFLEEQAIPKDKKVLMYCTGGIRCEKALHEMKQRGFESVFQLDGGILKYLEVFPHRSFEGECFVFDHRVSVDQQLQPSKQYKLCPHCGNPGDKIIICRECNSSAVVCVKCFCEESNRTCSKNCAHHSKRKTQLQVPAEKVS